MRGRPAFTLLEVLLAMAIAVLLLGALYTAVAWQLQHAQAGRDVIEKSTLARAIVQRIGSDVSCVVSLSDPARFRRPSAASSSTGTTTTTGTTTSTTGTTSSTSSSPMTGTTQNAGLEIPLGVVGDATTLHLFLSKVPGEVFGARPGEPGALTSDLRRVSYWLSTEGAGGLCRLEARLITAEDALDPDVPAGDVAQYIMAPEVRSLEFQYFDGTSWVESWDATLPGADGVTPMGSPRAISIRIGLAITGAKQDPEAELRYHRHVVFLPTAGGMPLTMEDGTVP